MKDNLKKLAERSKKAELVTDNALQRLIALPYSWLVVVPVVLLALYGAVRLVA